MASNPKKTGEAPLLIRVLKLGLRPMLFAALFSLVSNLLYLTLPIYTNQVYGRVLQSESLSTLVIITLGAVFVFAISNLMDELRSQVLTSFGVLLDQQVASRTFAALFDRVIRRQPGGGQVLRDLDMVRQSIGGAAIAVMFDVPWIPIFMIMLFLISPWIGLMTLVGGILLLLLAVMQDRATRDMLKTSNDANLQSYNFTDAALRNAEVVRAMGMLPALGRLWIYYRHIGVEVGSRALDRTSFYAGMIRYVRMLIQVLTIALGAVLIIDHQMASGLLFANMIVSARALAPVERIVGSWNALFMAKQAYDRLNKTLEEFDPQESSMQLPRPAGAVAVENVSFAPGGSPTLVLTALNFSINAGEMVGIIGPSGAGKSTLVRLICGIWKPSSGTVRLDGADVYTWDREDFGRHVGYQPQDTELFAGTIRDNICRFRADAEDQDVIRAAELANAHDLILRLPNGYETRLGEGGHVLSAGQRQRVGLARTMFGDPSLVILDEPNANLDGEGEAALDRAIGALKERGATIILISHKPSAFGHADKLLILQNGTVTGYGQRDEVMKALGLPIPAKPAIEAANA
jgi:ATP-binding cassette subfamily C exporter for protease/lipase